MAARFNSQKMFSSQIFEEKFLEKDLSSVAGIVKKTSVKYFYIHSCSSSLNFIDQPILTRAFCT